MFFIAWGGSEDNNGGVFIRPFSVAGVPLRSELKIDDGDQLIDKSQPSIQVVGNSLIVSWQVGSNEDSDIQSRVIMVNDGVEKLGFSSPPSFSVTRSYNNETHAVVAGFRGGNFVVVWEVNSYVADQNLTTCCSSSLYARFFQKDGTPTENWLCISNNANFSNAHDPSLTTLGNGNFLLTWTTKDMGIGYHIYENQVPEFDRNPVRSYFSDIKTVGEELNLPLKQYFKLDPEGSELTCLARICLAKQDGEILKCDIQFPYGNLMFDETSCTLTSKPLQMNDNGAKIGLIGTDLENTYDTTDLDNAYGAGGIFPLRVNPPEAEDGLSEPAKRVLYSLASILGSVLLSVLGYRWRQYQQKKYREFQHHFASEIHAWLNLAYSDFSVDPGKRYSELVTRMLQLIREKAQLNVQRLKHSKPADQALYYFLAYLFARAIHDDPYLLRDTEVCGIRLRGFLASKEILLSELEEQLEEIVEQVNNRFQQSPEPPKEWKEVIEQQAAIEEREAFDSSCRKKVRQACAPFRSSTDHFTLFRNNQIKQDRLVRDRKSSLIKTTTSSERELRETKEAGTHKPFIATSSSTTSPDAAANAYSGTFFGASYEESTLTDGVEMTGTVATKATNLGLGQSQALDN